MVRVEPATVAWLEALVQGDEVFDQRFGVRVEPDWAGFPEAVPSSSPSAVTAGRRSGPHLFFPRDEAR